MIPIDPKTKALIFDCDGTLVDTMDLHIRAWREALQEYGYDYPLDFVGKFGGVPTYKIVEKLISEKNFKLNLEEFAREKEKLAGKLISQYAKPIEPVVAVARANYKKLPMCVVSGGTRENVRIALSTGNLEPLFDFILSADDHHEHKPNPGVFLEAARRLNVAPDLCQVFEDGEPGFVAARAAGMMLTDVREFLKQP